MLTPTKPLARSRYARGVGVQRVAVRDVAQVGAEERRPRRGVYRFEHHARPGAEGAVGVGEHPHQVVGLEVLDDLGRKEAAERLVGQGAQMAEGVAPGRVQPPLAAALDRLRVGVDAAGGDAVVAQQGEELSAAAAQVEHVRRALEVGQIGALPLRDLLRRPAEHVLEADVLVGVQIRRGRNRGGRCGVPGVGVPGFAAARGVRRRPGREVQLLDLALQPVGRRGREFDGLAQAVRGALQIPQFARGPLQGPAQFARGPLQGPALFVRGPLQGPTEFARGPSWDCSRSRSVRLRWPR